MDFYIDETVYTGSPEDMSGRLPREIRTYALLDTLGIPFTRVDHDATATIDACLEVEKILGIHICKNLFLCNAQKTRFYLLKIFQSRSIPPGCPLPETNTWSSS